jgi:hypothetical protein
MKALVASGVLAAVLICQLLFGGTAYADHTTRPLILEDNGLDYRLVALTMLMVVAALSAFVVIVLRWERRDEQRERERRGERR